ncbi:putative outer membrane protein [Algibacter lectus]|uniref:Putative outer membrane protein n=1 Tax=Algibacter lectus TaxID=221126 RepID=A0A090VJL4_9FLAO|nr:putative outer membrane protein [Algibacter lectus]
MDMSLSKGAFIYEFSEESTIIIKSKVSEEKPIVEVIKVLKKTIKGNVVDENGVPLSGVSVLVKNTKNGAYTDFDGNFTINLADSNDNVILVFSYLGFENQEITVGDQAFINLKMKASLSGLDEVLVIGYGTTKIRDATGVISRIDKQDIEDAPMGNTIESLLEGKASGVNVQVQSASPTSPISIIIRGSSSLNGDNQPLWVIDGVPQDGLTLDDLNLDTVESIDVLKDASSTAIYGSRGAQGVVIVTTKRGQRNREPVFTFSSSISATVTDFNSFEYFDGPQYEAI